MFHLGRPYIQSIPRKATEEERILIISTFDEADEGGKGFLTREDIKVATAIFFGYKPSKYEVDQIFEQEYKKNAKSEGISIETFTDAMSLKMGCKDEDEEIRHTFMAFDTQCRGFLTLQDLKKVFSQVAPCIALHTIEAAFREIDRDGDGRVSYKDFEFMMKYSLQDEL